MNDALTPVFAALADPTRRTILERLQAGEASAGTLAEPFDLSQPAISRHLKVMQTAGLIASRRDGTRRMFRLAPHRIEEMDAWLNLFRTNLEASYSRLDTLLAEGD